jgi:surface protein
MEFNRCMSLTTVDASSLDTSKCSRMVMLDEMTFNQIEWCKKKGIIENLKSEVAKELNMCAFYALISSDLIDEFDAL